MARSTRQRQHFDNRFLYYYLSSPSTYNKFKSLAVGGVVNNLNSEMVRNVEVPVPSIDDQLEVVNSLETLRHLITLRKQQLGKLDELVKARFVEMFGDPVSNSRNWNALPLCMVAPMEVYKGKFEDLCWALTLDMIESQTGRILEYKYLPIDEIGTSVCAFSEENVLYSKLRPYLNKVVLPDRKGIATSELIPLKPKNVLNRIFLASLLRTDSFVRYINEKVAGAKMPRVSMDVFRKFLCILPSVEEQNQFALFVKKAEQTKTTIMQSLAKLEMLKKALMQKYFS